MLRIILPNIVDNRVLLGPDFFLIINESAKLLENLQIADQNKIACTKSKKRVKSCYNLRF